MSTVRRVVTGHDAAGRAVVVSDGPSPFVYRNPGTPGFVSTDIWRSSETPALLVDQPEEPTPGPRRRISPRWATRRPRQDRHDGIR
jgi:hypothetical protein